MNVSKTAKIWVDSVYSTSAAGTQAVGLLVYTPLKEMRDNLSSIEWANFC